MPMPPRGAMPVAASASGSHGRARQLFVLILAAAVLAGACTIVSARPVAASVEPASITERIGTRLWLAIDRAMAAVVEAQRPSHREPSKARRRSVAAQQLRPRPAPGPFGMNLYRRGDFVSQQTEYWCVSAAAQTMLNILEPGKPDRTRAFQLRLHLQARRLDQDEDDRERRREMGQVRWQNGLHGLGLTDWAELLDVRGHGPYEVDRATTRKHAIRKAARAIRLTGKPAGLVVWRGAHAWVMSGFEATADPAYSERYKVTSAYIQDPWYPYISSIWGASRPPNAAVPTRALGIDFLRYDRPGRVHPKRDGKYMLILPVADEAANRR